MWCANCQSEVAAEVAADNRRIHCASCGREIGASQSVAPTTKMREARELLERWSNTPLLDPFGPLPELRTNGAPAIDLPLESELPEEPAGRRHRIDAAHGGAVGGAAGEGLGEPWLRFPQEPLGQAATGGAPTEPGMWSSGAGPHFGSSPVSDRPSPRKGNWSSTLGQLMAYGGVGVITIGTTLVLSGYFGGPANYAPTGWLVTTAGQMLLFLGVVTLVSGGMEQTTSEVARRIDTLGEKLLRIELAARGHALRGPSLPAERFAGAESGKPGSGGRRPAESGRVSSGF